MGNVKHLNPVAEKHTGLKAFDVLDKPVEEVFVIVDEYTRLKAENPG